MGSILIIYNIIIWNICFLIVYNKTVVKPNYDLTICRNPEKPYRWLAILFILYSLFTFFGGDIIKDEEFVSGGYHDQASYEFSSIEGIYIWLASYSFGFLLIYKILVYVPAIIFTFWGLKVLKLDNYYTLLFFVVFCLQSYGSTRGVLAFSIFLLGVAYIGKKRWNKFLGLTMVISSYFFHSSMILPILILPLCIFKIKKGVIIAILLSMPVLIGGIDYISFLFEEGTFGFAGQAAHKYQDYVNNYSDEESYGSKAWRIFEIVNILTMIIAVLISVRGYLYQKLEHSIKLLYNVGLLLLFFSLIMKFSDFPAHNIFYARFFSMSGFLIYATFPNMFCEYAKNRKYIQTIAKLGFIKVNLYYLIFIYNIYA